MKILSYVSNIFTSKKTKLYRDLIKILGNQTAIFNDFGNDVYASDFVNNCIDRIATEISKINIMSVVDKKGRIQIENDDITRLFKYRPNPLQTTKDFLACCEWLRRKEHNCFIYPQYKYVEGSNGVLYKKYIAFYPLNPTKVEFGVDSNNEWLIKFEFRGGENYILPYNEIIHLRWRRGKNTVVGGGDDNARSDTGDLLKSLNILDKVMQGLPKSIEASLKINGVFSAKTLMDAEKLGKARAEFEEHIHLSESGIVATDLSGEFQPTKMNPAKIDPVVLKFLKSIIRERFGISDEILSGKYDGDDHSAFYQNCIEEFIIEFEQASSSVLFSDREQIVGHRIKCYYNLVSYLSTKDKIELANIAKDTGNMTLNEVNDMLGMPPFEGGDRRLQSLNYCSSEVVDKYQLEKVGGKSEPTN